MKEARERNMSLADAVLMVVCDPFGLVCFLVVFGKFWKIGLILLALILVVGLITGFLILWTNRWDT